MSSPSTQDTAAAVGLLTLPTLDGLTEGQVRGHTCIWCDIPLTVETAVDLGERRHRRLDGHYSTFPRGCRPCTGKQALATLHDHAPGCGPCRTDAADCEKGVALRRLMRGGWR